VAASNNESFQRESTHLDVWRWPLMRGNSVSEHSSCIQTRRRILKTRGASVVVSGVAGRSVGDGADANASKDDDNARSVTGGETTNGTGGSDDG
jgi:hypothetical protein